MELKDFIITPIYLIFFTAVAYFIRPYLTNEQTKKYFLPALWIRFVGAIALGLIYQFYYGGGDTFNYFNQGSIIYDAILDDPFIGVKILLNDREISSETYAYISRIYWFDAPSEYFVIRIIGFLSLFTFNSYIGVSLFFASFSFTGVWLIYSCLQSRFPDKNYWLALGILFLPTAVFWGSGVLKDSLAMGGLGIVFWCLYQVIEERKYSFKVLILLASSIWLIISIKIYIVLCLIPSALIWWYFKSISNFHNTVARILIVPVFMFFFLGLGFLLLVNLSSSSEKYSLDSIAERSYITSNDIRYWTGRNAGSGYDIGTQDGTWQTLVTLAPKAIGVSLFRPYLWEVSNPLMLLSAIESSFLLLLTFRVFPSFLRSRNLSPLMIFLIVFSLTFAFAVGVSTYNFGTLSRYKIPLLPFYLALLVTVQKRK